MHMPRTAECNTRRATLAVLAAVTALFALGAFAQDRAGQPARDGGKRADSITGQPAKTDPFVKPTGRRTGSGTETTVSTGAANTAKQAEVEAEAAASPFGAEAEQQGTQIRIDAFFVSFLMKDISRIAATGTLDTATLEKLWAAGEGELLTSLGTVAPPGQECVVKDVKEITYPTSYTVQTNGTSSLVVVPEGFQTREVGGILQVVPEIDSAQRVKVTVSSQLVDPPTWENYGPKYVDAKGVERQLAMRQPQFPAWAVNTSVTLRNRERALVGGGKNNADGTRSVFLFLTATLVDSKR
jgi:hypothetical protein